MYLAEQIDDVPFAPYAWLTWAAEAARGRPAAPAQQGVQTDSGDLAVLSRHGRSFRLAGRLLGPESFARAAALYATCRTIDDLADEAPDRAAAAIALRAISDDLAGSGPVTGLGSRFRSLGVDRQAAGSLVDTMLSDLGPVRIEDEAGLLRYAHGAAGTVGLMMCDVLGVTDPAARRHAIDLGIAMQLTNIARDVGEDARRDRMYLPRDWLPDRLSPASLDAHTGAAFQAVRRLLALADLYYRSGAHGYPALPGRSALAIPVAARLYRQIGRQVLAAGPGYLVGPRLVVGPATRVALVASCVGHRLLVAPVALAATLASRSAPN
jgi:phytoene synthase